MVILDANMILRYLLNDNAEMADTADHIIHDGDAAVTIEVIAEVIYVLGNVYRMKRAEIADTLKRFLSLVDCRDGNVLRIAVETFAAINLDFVDCVLYAYHKVDGTQIATFDKKLLKLIHG